MGEQQQQTKENNFYAVAKGRKCGIFTDWCQCHKQVNNVLEAVYECITTIDEAVSYMLDNSDILRDNILVYDRRGRSSSLTQFINATSQDDVTATVADTASDSDVIFNPVLSYVAFALDTSTTDHVNNCCVQFYDVEELNHAKDTLWNTVDNDLIGPYIRRRDGTTRSEAEALCIDITSAIQKLDLADKLPRIAVDYAGLHRIPKALPSETNALSMCERLVTMESRLKEMEYTLSNNVCKTMSIEEKVNNMTSYSSAATRRMTPSAPPLPVQQHEHVMPQTRPSIIIQSPGSSATNRDNPVTVSRPGNNQRNDLRPDVTNDPRMSRIQTHLHRSTSERSIASATSQHSAPYEFQRAARRKTQRRAAPVVGTGCADRFRGAPEPSRDLFVFRIEHGYTVEDIKKYVIDSNIVVREIEQTSKDESTFMSFKVTIKASDMNAVLQPEFWPMGVCVRRFWRPRSQYIESNSR